MEKVKIKERADSGKKWNDKAIYNVELVDGRKGSCFDPAIMNIAVGVETELDIKEGKEYQGVKQYIFNLPKANNKGGGYPPRNPAPDHRAAALRCAVDMVIAGKVATDKFKDCRDSYYLYISEGK